MEPTRLLFVCWGNICRSPTAEGIMRALVRDAGLDGIIEVDSAGTSNEHPGEPPDRRAIAEAARRGIDIADLRARQLRRDDFDRYDLLLVVDDVIDGRVRRLAPDDAAAAKVVSLVSFGSDPQVRDIADPWYGGAPEFVATFDLIDDLCRGLLTSLREGRATA